MIRSRSRARNGGGAWFTQGKADGIDPTLWADFANNRYAVNGVTKTFSNLLTTTRGSVANYFDQYGVMREAAINTPRFDYDPTTMTKKLRAATARNQINHTKVNTAGMDGCVIEFTEVMGNDTTALILSFSQKFLDATLGDQNVGNGYTIQEVAIVNGARTISVPVYFGGSRSKVINDGDIDVQSDPIFPLAFGLPKFSRDEKYYIKARITGSIGFYVAAGNNTWGNYGNTGDNVIIYWYNSASTTPSNTDLTTRYTASGTAFTWGYNGPKPLVLGWVAGTDTSVVAIGDSISASVDDGITNSNWGAGLFQRSMRSEVYNDTTASINLAVSSMKLSVFNTSTYAQSFIQYAQSAFVFQGTNDVQASPTLATMQSRFNTLFTMLRSAGIRKIILHKLLTYTTSTDSWATEESQTAANPNWVPGAVVDQLNSWFDTKFSDGTVDYLHEGLSVVNAITRVWKAGSVTGDGLHPNATGHELLAVNLRPSIRAVSVATGYSATVKGLLIEGGRTNLVLNSMTGSAQSITTTAQDYTLTFYGTGTVTLSGTYAGALVGSGAYPVRSTLTFTATAGTLNIAVSGTVQMIQIEAGKFASSYIKTTGASTTRSADYINTTSAPTTFASWYNASEFTVLSDAIYYGGDVAFPRLYEISDGLANTNNTVVFNQTASNLISGQVYSAGAYQGNSAFPAVDIRNARYKIANAVKLNNAGACLNGGSVGVDNVLTMPVGVTKMDVGSNSLNTSASFMHLKELRFYQKRISNAELQRLTT